MTEALYTRDILRLATSIPHQQRLEKPDGTAEKRSQTCGSRVAADVILSADQKIEQLGLEVNACALGQASAAILGAQIMGKTIAEIAAARHDLAAFFDGEKNDPGDWDKIEHLMSAKDHRGRHAAILLPYDALIAAIEAALLQKARV